MCDCPERLGREEGRNGREVEEGGRFWREEERPGTLWREKERPVIEEEEGGRLWREEEKPERVWRQEERPGRGVCLVAAKYLAPGDLILVGLLVERDKRFNLILLTQTYFRKFVLLSFLIQVTFYIEQ